MVRGCCCVFSSLVLELHLQGLPHLLSPQALPFVNVKQTPSPLLPHRKGTSWVPSCSRQCGVQIYLPLSFLWMKPRTFLTSLNHGTVPKTFAAMIFLSRHPPPPHPPPPSTTLTPGSSLDGCQISCFPPGWFCSRALRSQSNSCSYGILV